MRAAVGWVAALLGACAAPVAIDVDVPLDPADRALVVVVRSAAGRRFEAIDPSHPAPLPEAIAEPDHDVEVVVLAYDRPLAELGFAGAPGALEVAQGELSRGLGPWARAWRRTIAIDADGEWSAVGALDLDLAATELVVAAPCAPLEAHPFELPPLVDTITLTGDGDDGALLVARDPDGSERWLRLGPGAVEPVPKLVDGLAVSTLAATPDGALWIAGERYVGTSTIPELWVRPSSGAAPTQVPASPRMSGPAGRITWIAARSARLAWTMTDGGVIERYDAGTWDRSVVHRPPWPPSRHGALSAVDDDAVDALLPYTLNSRAPRTVLRVRGTRTTTLALAAPLPSTLAWVAGLGATVIGTADGATVVLGVSRIEAADERSSSEDVAVVAGVRYAGREGALYSGRNGFVAEYYPRSLSCDHPVVGYNVTEMVALREGWIVAGTGHAPTRRPAASWVVRAAAR